MVKNFIKNSLSYIDLFQVDSVHIKRQRKKTKNVFGGLLTLSVPLICIGVFLFLYFNNLQKEDIVTNEVFSTLTLTEPLKFKIEWNTDIVNVSSIYPIELVTSTGKQTYCYQSLIKNSKNELNTKDKSGEIELCNFDTDLLGEPNGVGFMFSTVVEKERKYVLPIKQNDFIMYHEKNIVAYVISEEKNNLCIYYISEFHSVCYYYKFLLEHNNLITYFNKFYINNTIYISVFENYNKKIFLFKNHTLFKTENTNCRYFASETTKICFSLFNETNYSVLFSDEKNGNNYNFTYPLSDSYSIDKYMNPDYFSFINFDPTTNIFKINYYSYNLNYTYKYQYKLINSTLYKIINNSSNELNFYYQINCPSEMFSLNLVFNNDFYRKNTNNIEFYIFNYEREKNNQIYFYTCFLTYNFDTLQFNSSLIFNIYNKTNDSLFSREKIHGTYLANTVMISDYIIEDKVQNKYQVINFFIIDDQLNIHKINTTKDILYWLTENVWSCSKTKDNTFIFTMLSSSYPINNNWNSVINIGNIIECTSYSVDCFPLYSSTLNSILKNDTQLIKDNTWIAKLYISTNSDTNLKNGNKKNNNILILNYTDILTSLSMQNEYKIQAYNLAKRNDDFYFGLSNYKRLYSININNELLTNSSISGFSNYYIYDNKQLGHDKKFSCIPNPDTNDIDFDKNTIMKNKVECPVYNYINYPFISDDGYQIADNNLITNKHSSNNQIGMFLLNLDPLFIKTTTTSTKASIYTIIGNTLSVYSTLITLFLFIKNKVHNFENKIELNRRQTIDENEIESGSIVYTDNQIYTSNSITNTNKVDKLNVQLSTIRNSESYVEKLSDIV
jgi:hypothetical protein